MPLEKKSKKIKDENSELANITNIFEKYDIQEDDEKSTNFLLAPDETVIKISCGPLHTVVVTNRNRMFACGYGEKYCLGNGKPITTS